MRDMFHFGPESLEFFIDGQLIESLFNWAKVTQTIDFQRFSFCFLFDG
jgi:hypothetical protein